MHRVSFERQFPLWIIRPRLLCDGPQYLSHGMEGMHVLPACCRQSLFGKSIHSLTGCGQAVVGILVLIALFLHPLGWGAKRVKRLCGPEAESFYYGECSLGLAMISAVATVFLSFCCAFLSLKAESSNLRSRVRRRVEHGEKLVCIP